MSETRETKPNLLRYEGKKATMLTADGATQFSVPDILMQIMVLNFHNLLDREEHKRIQVEMRSMNQFLTALYGRYAEPVPMYLTETMHAIVLLSQHRETAPETPEERVMDDQLEAVRYQGLSMLVKDPDGTIATVSLADLLYRFLVTEFEGSEGGTYKDRDEAQQMMDQLRGMREDVIDGVGFTSYPPVPVITLLLTAEGRVAAWLADNP